MSAGSRHERVGALFLAAKEMPAGERGAYLDRECAADAELRAEVESLLECLDDAIDLERPAGFGAMRPDCRGDIEPIVGRAFEKEPSQRRTSAFDLAEDTGRDSSVRPVLARRPSLRYRAIEFACRNRGLVGGAAATLLVLVLGFVAIPKYAFDTNEPSRIARWSSYRTAINAAAAEIRSGDVARARGLLDEAPAEHRGWEWHYLVRNLEAWSLRVPLAARPVGAIGVRNANTIVLALANGRLEAWSTEAGSLVDEVDLGEPLSALAAETTAGIGVVGSANGTVSVVDLFTFEVLASRSLHELLDDETAEEAGPDATAVTAVAIDPRRDAIWIARASDLASVDRSLERVSWRVATPANDKANVPVLSDLGAASGDRLVALVAKNGRNPVVQLVDAATGAWGEQLSVSEGAWSLASSASGSRIAVGMQDRDIHVIDLDDATRKVLDGHANAVRHIAFSDHERRLVSLDVENEIRVWWLDVEAPGRIFQLPEDVRGESVGFFPPSSRIVATTPYEWFVFDEARTFGRVLRGHDRYLQSVHWSPDGATLLTGANQDGIGVWDVASGRLAAKIRVGSDLGRLELTANGRRLVGRRVSWDVATGERLAGSFDSQLPLIRIGPHGTFRLQSRSKRVDIMPFDASADAEPADSLPIGAPIHDLAMHPDGRRLFVATKDGVSVWDIHDRRPLASLDAHRGHVDCVEIDAEGTRIFTGGNDGSIWIWDATTLDPLLELKGHTSYVMDVALSPDGATLASTSGDATARLWETTPEHRRHAASREYDAARHHIDSRVDIWLDELGEPSRVAQKIRDDDTMDAVTRRAALHALLAASVDKARHRGTTAGQ